MLEFILSFLFGGLPLWIGLAILFFLEYDKPRPDLPPKEYPNEPICDRVFRRDVAPLFEKRAEITKRYFEMRIRRAEQSSKRS